MTTKISKYINYESSKDEKVISFRFSPKFRYGGEILILLISIGLFLFVYNIKKNDIGGIIFFTGWVTFFSYLFISFLKRKREKISFNKNESHIKISGSNRRKKVFKKEEIETLVWKHEVSHFRGTYTYSDSLILQLKYGKRVRLLQLFNYGGGNDATYSKLQKQSSKVVLELCDWIDVDLVHEEKNK